MFSHFLITQFNLLSFPLGEEIEHGEKWLNWTRKRIPLFKQYCLPSLDNQTNKNFTWLIYFDSQTPDEFKGLIKELESRSYIKVCYADGNDGFMRDHISHIKKLSAGKKWIISSRIDNDDVFHKNAIQTIQNAFVAKDEYLISLSSGYTLNTSTKTMGHYYYPGCPFISIIEAVDKSKLKSIYYKSHGHWEALKLKVWRELFQRKNKRATFILSHPYWIQLVHGDNVSNSERRGFPILKQQDLSDFSLNMVTKKQSVFIIPSFFNYVHWKRYFRATILKFLSFK